MALGVGELTLLFKHLRLGFQLPNLRRTITRIGYFDELYLRDLDVA